MTIQEVYQGLPAAKKATLEGVYRNVIFMENKLYETLQDAQNEPLTVFYDNGGGQTGTRENPIFKAYESLFKSYLSGVKTILDAVPDGINLDVDQPATVLQLVREKHA